MPTRRAILSVFDTTAPHVLDSITSIETRLNEKGDREGGAAR